jgi:hypothetical protein
VMLRAEPMAAGHRLRFDIKRGDTVAATGVVER